MNRFQLKIIINLWSTTLFSIITMRIFHTLFVLRSVERGMQGLTIYIAVTLTLLIVITIIFMVKTRPIEKMLQAFEQNQPVTPEKIKQSLSVISSLPRVIIIVIIIGFFIGPIVTILIQNRTRGFPLWTFSNYFAVINSICFGFLTASTQINLTNLILAPVTQKMRIYQFPLNEKIKSYRFQQNIHFSGYLCFGLSLMISALFFYRENPESASFFKEFIPLLLFTTATAGTAYYLFTHNHHIQQNQLGLHLQEISEGKRSVDQMQSLTSFDEMGKLTESSNNLLLTLGDSIQQLGQVSHQLISGSNELRDSSEQSLEGIKRNSNSIKEIESALAEQDVQLNDSLKSAEEIQGSAALVKDSIARTLESVEQVQESFLVVQNAMLDTSENTQEAVNTTAKLEELIERSQKAMEKTSEDVEELLGKLSSISEISSVINKISSQTNMLAMNASIEAAHAGASGQGFAVVAEEVRKLADQTANSAKQIKSTVTELSTGISETREQTKISLDAFQAIYNEVELNRKNVGDIDEHFQIQQKSMDDSAPSIRQLNETTRLVARNSEMQNAHSNEIHTKIRAALESFHHVLETTKTQTEELNHMNQLINQSVEMSQSQAGLVDQLKSLMNRLGSI